MQYLNNGYPAQQVSRPTIVYMPQMGNKKVNKSVSVIAIVLLFAVLLVGMKLISEEGFYQKIKLKWNRGYINTETGLAEKTSFGKAYGMYTVEPIEIENGVKIDLKFGSKLTYQIFVYDENDSFLGILGNPMATGQKLDKDKIDGVYPRAKYIRLFAYEVKESEDGNLPNDEKFSVFDMWFRSGNIKVSGLAESNIGDNLGDIFG